MFEIYFSSFVSLSQPPAQGGAVVPARPGAVVAPTSGPVTGIRNVGVQRAQIKQGESGHGSLCVVALVHCAIAQHGFCVVLV